jgi:hypothetical protein
MTADQRDRIRAQVVASRRAQGLQATVPESRFLAELSAAILDQDPDLAPAPEPVRAERVRMKDDAA